MNCPTCGTEMLKTGCKVTELPFHRCVRCGTMRDCEGGVSVPLLVEFCRKFHECMIEARQPEGLEALKIIGITDSVFPPESRRQ